MIGSESALLGQIVNAANNWRTTATGAGVKLSQLNLVLPDGRGLVLIWDDHAKDNGDGTFTADWVVTSFPS
jgi:hypothetical protein